MAKTSQPQKRKKSRAKKVLNEVRIPSGWNTTDEDEIKRRRLRAQTQFMQVTTLEDGNEPYFNTYTVQSQSSVQPYTVEIRSLHEYINSCTCADYDGNGLGTCKHIEKVFLTLQKKGIRKFRKASVQGSAKCEIYVDPFDNQIKIKWPVPINAQSYILLKDFFSAQGTLLSDAKTAIPVILGHIERAPDKVQQSIRVSNKISGFLTHSDDFAQKIESKNFFLQDVIDGKYTLDIAKLPLYDYQKEGILHLAFLEKAILADEMGLGKTVQAIIAAALLRKLHHIQKVLVVTPTSLKAEWEEQITKFVNLPSLLVYGNRAERLRQYQKDAFFYIANYEQVVRDHEDIQRLIAPDVVILDEAQRIKNWRTKTAATIKQLMSPYAFVLTGTPIENRLDDIYSIVQFLYPKFFGSLFRFNREFYQLDEHGKPTGYKNLHLLHQRLKPILLRRLKRDVEDQLPERTINTYFVQMSEEQKLRYEDQEAIVSRIAALAGKRPLQEEEFKRLQKALASMRMLCDTPYILDEKCRICPKLEELESILEEILQEETTKIIIFSEWERMLTLVRELLEKMNIGYAWHTGSLDQKKRREEIYRFKGEIPDKKSCRVFLSTDCGSVGLNLQAANVVINLDLPWNPAKLEQRIARAWRKHQTRTVSVINFVSEDTLEHRMLGVLDLKQRLFENVLDLGDIEEMDIPSGRKAFMDQLGKIIEETSSYANSQTKAHPSTNTIFHPNLDQVSVKQSELDQTKGLASTTGGEANVTQQRDLKEDLQTDALTNDSTSQDVYAKDLGTRFGQEVLARFKPRIHQLSIYEDHNGNQTIFAVVDGDLAHPREQMQIILDQITENDHKEQYREINESHQHQGLRLEVLDRAAFDTIQRLCNAGVLSFNQAKTKSLYHSQPAELSNQKEKEREKCLKIAQQYKEQAIRKERMATLLIEGGFHEEAWTPLREGFELSLKSFASLIGSPVEKEKPLDIDKVHLHLYLQPHSQHMEYLSKEIVKIAAYLRKEDIAKESSPDQEMMTKTHQSIQTMNQFLINKINEYALNAESTL